MRREELDPIEFEEQKAPAKMIAGFELMVVIRLGVALALLLLGFLLPAIELLQLALMLASFFVAGYDVLIDAFYGIVRRHMPDENFLVVVAALAAFAVRLDYEGAAIMLVYRLGRLFLRYAMDRSKRSVESVTNPCPAQAVLVQDEGEVTVPADTLKPGDTIVLRPGDCACVDCLVTDGYSTIDTSAVTGSTQVASVEEGDVIVSGAVNVSSAIQAEVIGAPAASTLARAHAFLQEEESDKSSLENLADKYARFFAPVALAISALFAVLVTLIGKVTPAEGIHRALTMLVVFFPGSLAAALPVVYFTGLRGASFRGILFRGSGAMETVASVKAVLFDKPGTVTTGAYQIDSIRSDKVDADTLLKAAAHAAANAENPAAKAVVAAYGGPIEYSIISDFTEHEDGVSVTIEGLRVLMGSREFLAACGVTLENADTPDRLNVHLCFSGLYAGTILLTDSIQPNAALAVSALENQGIADIILLSEDSNDKTRSMAQMIGISKYYSQCLPMDKLARVQEMSDRAGKNGALFVGSGLSDAATFAAADVGFLLGGLDAGTVVGSACVVAMDSNIEKVPSAVAAAHNTDAVAKQGLLAALLVKALLLLIALFGLTNQAWFAVLLDSCITIGCVLNAVRAFSWKEKH